MITNKQKSTEKTNDIDIDRAVCSFPVFTWTLAAELVLLPLIIAAPPMMIPFASRSNLKKGNAQCGTLNLTLFQILLTGLAYPFAAMLLTFSFPGLLGPWTLSVAIPLCTIGFVFVVYYFDIDQGFGEIEKFLGVFGLIVPIWIAFFVKCCLLDSRKNSKEIGENFPGKCDHNHAGEEIVDVHGAAATANVLHKSVEMRAEIASNLLKHSKGDSTASGAATEQRNREQEQQQRQQQPHHKHHHQQQHLQKYAIDNQRESMREDARRDGNGKVRTRTRTAASITEIETDGDLDRDRDRDTVVEQRESTISLLVNIDLSTYSPPSPPPPPIATPTYTSHTSGRGISSCSSSSATQRDSAFHIPHPDRDPDVDAYIIGAGLAGERVGGGGREGAVEKQEEEEEEAGSSFYDIRSTTFGTSPFHADLAVHRSTITQLQHSVRQHRSHALHSEQHKQQQRTSEQVDHSHLSFSSPIFKNMQNQRTNPQNTTPNRGSAGGFCAFCAGSLRVCAVWRFHRIWNAICTETDIPHGACGSPIYFSRLLPLLAKVMLCGWIIIAAYGFCNEFTTLFEQHSQNSAFVTVSLILWFSITMQLIKLLGTLAGRWVDSVRGVGTVAIEVIMWITITVYSQVFYRNIFSHVESYGQFFVIKAVRILFFLGIYPVLLSRRFRKLHTWLRSDDRLKNDFSPSPTVSPYPSVSSYPLISPSLSVSSSFSSSSASSGTSFTNSTSLNATITPTHMPTTAAAVPGAAIPVVVIVSRKQALLNFLWWAFILLYRLATPPAAVYRQRTSIHLALETVLSFQTSLAYLIFWSFLRFGYNREYFPIISSTSRRDFDLLATFIAVSALIDVGVLYSLHLFLLRRGRGREKDRARGGGGGGGTITTTATVAGTERSAGDPYNLSSLGIWGKDSPNDREVGDKAVRTARKGVEEEEEEEQKNEGYLFWENNGGIDSLGRHNLGANKDRRGDKRKKEAVILGGQHHSGKGLFDQLAVVLETDFRYKVYFIWCLSHVTADIFLANLVCN